MSFGLNFFYRFPLLFIDASVLIKTEYQILTELNWSVVVPPPHIFVSNWVSGRTIMSPFPSLSSFHLNLHLSLPPFEFGSSLWFWGYGGDVLLVLSIQFPELFSVGSPICPTPGFFLRMYKFSSHTLE